MPAVAPYVPSLNPRTNDLAVSPVADSPPVTNHHRMTENRRRTRADVARALKALGFVALGAAIVAGLYDRDHASVLYFAAGIALLFAATFIAPLP